MLLTIADQTTIPESPQESDVLCRGSGKELVIPWLNMFDEVLDQTKIHHISLLLVYSL